MLKVNTYKNTMPMHTHVSCCSDTSCHSRNLLNFWIGWMMF